MAFKYSSLPRLLQFFFLHENQTRGIHEEVQYQKQNLDTHLLTFASTFHNRDQYQDISNGSDDAADEHEDISLLE
jgi:hypothetical protein